MVITVSLPSPDHIPIGFLYQVGQDEKPGRPMTSQGSDDMDPPVLLSIEDNLPVMAVHVTSYRIEPWEGLMKWSFTLLQGRLLIHPVPFRWRPSYCLIP